jgi:hypothetical protein
VGYYWTRSTALLNDEETIITDTIPQTIDPTVLQPACIKLLDDTRAVQKYPPLHDAAEESSWTSYLGGNLEVASDCSTLVAHPSNETDNYNLILDQSTLAQGKDNLCSLFETVDQSEIPGCIP